MKQNKALTPKKGKLPEHGNRIVGELTSATIFRFQIFCSFFTCLITLATLLCCRECMNAFNQPFMNYYIGKVPKMLGYDVFHIQ